MSTIHTTPLLIILPFGGKCEVLSKVTITSKQSKTINDVNAENAVLLRLKGEKKEKCHFQP